MSVTLRAASGGVRREGGGTARFFLEAPYEPAGDQPGAIELLCRGIERGMEHQVLLGVTGSGKTFVMASVIERLGRPALVVTHNKTLAAQLYGEFRRFFPRNAVEYFVSYYDYYQPEAYLPATGTYIEKDASINDRIDRLRHSATRTVFERDDFVVVASVSCIYGLGDPAAYSSMHVPLAVGGSWERRELIDRLISIHYRRDDADFRRGSFRVRGDRVEVFPASSSLALRVVLRSGVIASLEEFDPRTAEVIRSLDSVALYPAQHYVLTPRRREEALRSIRAELDERCRELERAGRLEEAARLKRRTLADLAMIRNVGYCPGIENYSRHLDGREPGEAPHTLVDYIPPSTLVFVDESHMTLPQLRGMYRGDAARKSNLVEFGFRLPSAFDNRPLTYDEFMERTGQKIYVSATPGDEELALAASSGQVVELIVRPTGLVDPPMEVRPSKTQIDDVVGELRRVVGEGGRALVTTITKRTAERVCAYLQDLGMRVAYLHCDIDALERVEILRRLRSGDVDVLVGVNLLREGLDLPEVTLVAILDADYEGFLRSARSIVQISGRAARNVDGRVILYADRITGALEEALRECARRRRIQQEYNELHGIVPRSAARGMDAPLAPGADDPTEFADPAAPPCRDAPGAGAASPAACGENGCCADAEAEIARLESAMLEAARELRFEEAARLRDRLAALRRSLSGERGSGGRDGAGRRGAGRPRKRRRR